MKIAWLIVLVVLGGCAHIHDQICIDKNPIPIKCETLMGYEWQSCKITCKNIINWW